MIAETEVSSIYFVVDDEISEISVYALVSDDDHDIFSVMQGVSVNKKFIEHVQLYQFYFYNINVSS